MSVGGTIRQKQGKLYGLSIRGKPINWTQTKSAKRAWLFASARILRSETNTGEDEVILKLDIYGLVTPHNRWKKLQKRTTTTNKYTLAELFDWFRIRISEKSSR